MPMQFKDHPSEHEDPMDIVGSHQRSLVAAVMRTTGPILELGVGWYSTPILHAIASAQKRPLLTVDNNNDWLKQFARLQDAYSGHELRLVGWWGEFYWGEHPPEGYGVCFADQGQPIEREYAIRAMITKAKVWVLHDTEEPFAYGYSRTLKMFKYQTTDKCQKAWTTVASNEVDVTKWVPPLPPVEPTQDIT